MPLLDIDPLTGAVEHFHYDHTTKQSIITRTVNVDAVLDANTESYNDGSKAWKGDTGDIWHVARVPQDVLWVWLQDFNRVRPADEKVRSPYLSNKDWEDFLWLRLNSSEYRKLRTAPVIV